MTALPVHPPRGNPVLYNPYGRPPMFPNPFHHNPEGLAALGAVVGNLIATGAATLLSAGLWRQPPTSADLIVEDATADEAQAAIAAEQQRLLTELAAWNRRRHALSAALATVGSAVGAYIGASPHQATRAAVGAAIGTGAVRSINIVANPAIGLPGWVAGAAGAYIGAKGASPSYGAAAAAVT